MTGPAKNSDHKVLPGAERDAGPGVPSGMASPERTQVKLPAVNIPLPPSPSNSQSIIDLIDSGLQDAGQTAATPCRMECIDCGAVYETEQPQETCECPECHGVMYPLGLFNGGDRFLMGPTTARTTVIPIRFRC